MTYYGMTASSNIMKTPIQRDSMNRNNTRFFDIECKAYRKAYIDCKALKIY